MNIGPRFVWTSAGRVVCEKAKGITAVHGCQPGFTQNARLDRMLLVCQNLFQAIINGQKTSSPELPSFCSFFLSPVTLGCKFIQRFRRYQSTGYNIDIYFLFQELWDCQTLWFSLQSAPESSIVHYRPRVKKRKKKREKKLQICLHGAY